MKFWPFALAGLLLAVSARADTFDGGSFGDVRFALPAQAPTRYVTYISGLDGWTRGDDAVLVDLARDGALAVGVDARDYTENLRLRRRALRTNECVDVFQDVEDLSWRLQGQHPAAFYHPPIVVGRAEGGALAYAALAGARQGAYTASLALDPTPTVPVARPLCRLDAFVAAGDARSLAPIAAPQGALWTVFHGASAGREAFAALARAGTPMTDASEKVAGAKDEIAALTAAFAASATTSGVASLPLIELPAEKPSKTIVVFMSGDGGWREIDKTISESLQKQGVSVVGWDSLRYFWQRKSPREVAVDLAAVLTAYRAKWGGDAFVLSGFSFGADLMPILYNMLPEADRDRVVLISLLGLEAKADWEICIVGWFGAQPSDDATPLAPEFAKIPGDKLQCFYGAQERETYCKALTDPKAELIEMPGQHHFERHYDDIASRMIENLRRRGAL